MERLSVETTYKFEGAMDAFPTTDDVIEMMETIRQQTEIMGTAVIECVSLGSKVIEVNVRVL